MSFHAFTCRDCCCTACLPKSSRYTQGSNGRVISSPFAFGNDKKLSSAWKLSHMSTKLIFNLGRINVPKGSLRIKAVATLESKSLVQNENAHVGYDGSELGRESSRCAGQLEPSSDDSEELDDREKLRRSRISNANKGSTPWNKGRKHSPGTDMPIQLIKERTRLAMQNPKNYRDHVCSALARYYDASYGPERKPTKKPSGSTESTRRVPAKKKVSEKNSFSSGEIKIQKQRLRLRSKAPMYKDPLASSKMEMIKNIRAQRAAAESEKTEAVERARLLIAEAEKAAMALEVAATKSAVARASFIETRQLIAEAIQFIESVETAQISSSENEDPSVTSDEAITQDEKEAYTGVGELTEADSGRVNGTRTSSSHENEHPIFASYEVITEGGEELCTAVAGQTEAGNVKINGTKTLSSTNEDSSFGNFTSEYMVDAEEDLSPLLDMLNVLEDPAPLEDMLNSEEDLPRPSTSGYGLPPFGFDELIKQSDVRNEPNQLEPNGDGECSKNLQLNGTKVQFKEEETPCKPVTGATKKWIRWRLVAVGEEA